MKSIVVLICAVLFSIPPGCSYGQINPQINKRQVSGSNLSIESKPIPVKKLRDSNLNSKLVRDLGKSNTLETEVSESYFSKRGQKSWKITPSRAFGSGSLGFTILSGQLKRQSFILLGDFVRNEAVAYVGYITFDARKGETYLIRFIACHNCNHLGGDVYINAYAGGNQLKVHRQSGQFPILVEAQESGEMWIWVSAEHKVGGNERYPDLLSIREITIDEL